MSTNQLNVRIVKSRKLMNLKLKEGENPLVRHGGVSMYASVRKRKVVDLYAKDRDGNPVSVMVAQFRTAAPSGKTGKRHKKKKKIPKELPKGSGPYDPTGHGDCLACVPVDGVYVCYAVPCGYVHSPDGRDGGPPDHGPPPS